MTTQIYLIPVSHAEYLALEEKSRSGCAMLRA
jgi:hypothetical protein